MNKLRFCSLLVLTMMLVGLSSCSTETDPYKGMSEGGIFNQSQTALQNGRYDKAVSAFEALEAKYPYGEYAHIEQLNIIYAYYMDQDYISAQAAAERYIHLNPQGRYVDYAYYMDAMSLFAKNRSFLENYFPVDPAERDLVPAKQAFDAFNYVLQNYPQSPYANDSRLHMIYIRNMFARNDLQTAKYYYSRGAYVAALDNARTIVFHYQGAPVTGEALVMMYNCYQQLKLDSDAQTTLKIIQINYPAIYKKLTK
jgi:outer membrane protein assembly factor BamD